MKALDKSKRHAMLGVGTMTGFPMDSASFYNSHQVHIIEKLSCKSNNPQLSSLYCVF